MFLICHTRHPFPPSPIPPPPDYYHAPPPSPPPPPPPLPSRGYRWRPLRRVTHTAVQFLCLSAPLTISGPWLRAAAASLCHPPLPYSSQEGLPCLQPARPHTPGRTGPPNTADKNAGGTYMYRVQCTLYYTCTGIMKGFEKGRRHTKRY